MHFQNSSISQANLKQSIKLLYTAHKVKNKRAKSNFDSTKLFYYPVEKKANIAP